MPSSHESRRSYVSSVEQILAQPHPLHTSPAVRILGRQMDHNLADLQKNAPTKDHRQHAFSLATRFFDVPLYARISEQAMFGPKPFERVEDLDVLERNLSLVKKGLQEAEKALEFAPNAVLEFENSWMYYVQGSRKVSTVYRIYLSPTAEMAGAVFQALQNEIPKNLSYQMKTMDAQLRPIDYARVDKVIVYASREAVGPIWEAVQRVHAAHRRSFEKRIPPGGGEASPLEGISVAYEPKRIPGVDARTGTQVQADAVSARLTERSKAAFFHAAEMAAQDPATAHKGDLAKFFFSSLSVVTGKLRWYIPDLSEEKRKIFSELYTRVLYGVAFTAALKKEPISQSFLKARFLERVEAMPGLLTGAQIKHVKNTPELQTLITWGGWIEQQLERAVEMTGLALAFDWATTHKLPPSRGLEEILKVPDPITV